MLILKATSNHENTSHCLTRTAFNALAPRLSTNIPIERKCRFPFPCLEMCYEDLSKELQSNIENFTLLLLYRRWGRTGQTRLQQVTPSHKELTFNQNWKNPVSNPTDALGQASRLLVTFRPKLLNCSDENKTWASLPTCPWLKMALK